jgi:glycosyltransferase involved in cell wall biosynthesis
MMEAQSFGIPIIGTDVGGVREIVNERTGILLHRDAPAAEFADAIRQIFSLSIENQDVIRHSAQQQWGDRFNAAKNFNSFAAEISTR